MEAVVKKRSLGQFFTKNDFWLKKHIVDFIKKVNPDLIIDPFAGNGDMLFSVQKIGFKKIKGLDIDTTLNWDYNDSLVEIPYFSNSIIVTNPPYLTNYSAKRKGIYINVKKYFDSCHYDDIYQLAIEKCMVSDYGVMIVPETFINSNFPKDRLVSITIIEDNPFNDTENPVCVFCFNNKSKSFNEIKIYKNDVFIGNLDYFEKMRKIPNKKMPIKFNVSNGQIALRAVDTTNPLKPISFMKPQEIEYDLSEIKDSSRLITVIDLKVNNDLIEDIIRLSNQILFDFRDKTHDILLSPFKGNKKNGERRRRLDYLTARAILEESYEMLNPNPKLGLDWCK